MSVAKYLDPGQLDFDVVIFDEASQVTPEDALGTIMRGNQVVLLGDTNQLPPTSFFDQVVDQRDEDEQWAFSIKDVESILDLGQTAFPSKRLRWHYRSRHESLIAVSNQEFYDNELLIYPSPIQDDDELGLTLEHLPETIYDRGGSSVNREEARIVAQAAVDHYRSNPSKSLGIGTFSQAQQQAVQEEIERLRKENPDIDQYFSRDRDEHFFVKNLERIQGDERDVIFISVGYGYDADGQFSHNFGPLNEDGGWRRLNVLITRARERCVVYSNFTADALDMSKTNARGVKSLKVFLDYAENRNLRSLIDVGADPDSPFERSVINFLRDKGYEVHPQVGCAGFRIDIAIPDPEKPGRYVLGIECDGASYHSSPVARARDRQRQAVLEDRGWQIHRIWSTDWYRERKRTQEKLIEAVEDAIDRGALKITGYTSDGGTQHVDEPQTESGPSLESLQGDGIGPSLDDIGKPYSEASRVPYSRLGDHDVRSTTKAVIAVVDGEGPIHKEPLSKKIVDSSDVTRRGKKIKQTIRRAIRRADRKGKIRKDGEFLYPTDDDNVPIRRRENVETNIEWIPEEEIEGAVREILEKQYETPRDDLIKQTAQVFGFTRAGSRIQDRIGGVIDTMRKSEEIEKIDGKLALSD